MSTLPHAPQLAAAPPPAPPPADKAETYYDTPFEKAARKVLSWGVHPNHFTLLQLPILALQMAAAIEGWRLAFALLILPIIILDGGDGVLARVGKLTTKSGAVLDALFDLAGIVIVCWGATRFFPGETLWLLLLLFGNLVLFIQNALLEEKVIAYLRGPILAAVVFPEVLAAALVVNTVTLGFLILVRLPRTARAVGRQVLG